MITATEITPTRQMTLANGNSARVDFEGGKGKLHAVFEDKTATDVNVGDAVQVDGAELKVMSKGPARQGHTAIVAQPATFNRSVELV